MSNLLKLQKRYGLLDGTRTYVEWKLNLDTIHLKGIGEIRIRKNTSDKSVFKQIFINGEYDFSLPYTPRTIIDGGANIGLSTLFFHEKYPAAEIIAVEPDAQNYTQLKNNTAGIDKIKCRRSAIWSENKTVFLEITPDDTSGYRTMASGKSGIQVSGVTIENILDELRWQYIDILKLDIEGAESKLFTECHTPDWLRKTRCLVIETHDTLSPGCTAKVFSSLLNIETEVTVCGENYVVINNSIISK